MVASEDAPLTPAPARNASDVALAPPHTPVDRLRRQASASLSSFVHSARFEKLCNEAFDACDVDGSGTVDAGELFSALLLLNHYLNCMPLGKRQAPPSKQRVLEILKSHAHDASSDSLSRDDFHAVCRDVCCEVATGVPRNVFITFVLCPALGMCAKGLLLRGLGGVHPHAAWAISNIPDIVFVPVATALVTAAAPFLLERHDAAVARRRAASETSGAEHASRFSAAMAHVLALLLAVIVPVLLALAWPTLLEPRLEQLVGPQARSLRAALEPHMAPVVLRLHAATDGLAAWLARRAQR